MVIAPPSIEWWSQLTTTGMNCKPPLTVCKPSALWKPCRVKRWFRDEHKCPICLKHSVMNHSTSIWIHCFRYTSSIKKKSIVLQSRKKIETRSPNSRRKFRSQTSDNMDRWKAEMGRVREKRRVEKRRVEERRAEEREDQRRERVRRKKMQVRQRVGKSPNTVFFQCFVAPEGRKVGSLKQKLHPVVARSTFRVKMLKTPGVRTTFGRWGVVSRGRRKGLCTLSKVSKTWRFCSIFTYKHHYTTLHSNTLHYNYNYTFTTFHYTTLHPLYTTLHSTTLHYTTLKITLRYTTLNYTQYKYTTLTTTTTTSTSTLQLHVPQLQLQLQHY